MRRKKFRILKHIAQLYAWGASCGQVTSGEYSDLVQETQQKPYKRNKKAKQVSLSKPGKPSQVNTHTRHGSDLQLLKAT
jgi:hypothetical protein